MKRRILLALGALVVASSAVHFYLLDGVDGWLMSHGFADDTEYTAGYSDAAFRQVRWSSMTQEQVCHLLGEPFGEVWLYDDEYKVLFTGAVVEESYGTRPGSSEPRRGASREVARALAGVPTEVRWMYSRSAHGDSYRMRIVTFRSQRVSHTIHYFYPD